MAKETESVMTPFGHAVWSIVQSKGKISQAGMGRRIGEKTGWVVSRQAVNHYLYGTRDVPRDLVPALVKTFDLSDTEADRLKNLYFYGQGGSVGEKFDKGDAEGPILPGGARDRRDLSEGLRAVAEHRERHGAGGDAEDAQTGPVRGA